MQATAGSGDDCIILISKLTRWCKWNIILSS